MYLLKTCSASSKMFTSRCCRYVDLGTVFSSTSNCSRHPRPREQSLGRAACHVLLITLITITTVRISLVYRDLRYLRILCVQIIGRSDCLVIKDTRLLFLHHLTLQCAQNSRLVKIAWPLHRRQYVNGSQSTSYACSLLD